MRLVLPPSSRCSWATRHIRSGLFCLLTVLPVVSSIAADNPRAAELLKAGNEAVQRHDLPQAAARFREFLQQFPQAEEAKGVRLLLAKSLLDGPQRDFDGTIEALKPLLEDENFKESAERAPVLYQAGRAERGGAEQLLTRSRGANPTEADKLRSQAAERFTKATTHFADAANAFGKKAGSITVFEGKPLSEDLESAVLAKCDQAEMLLRNEKFPEVQKTIDPVLNHPVLRRSVQQPRAYFLHGRAAYALNDFSTAMSDLGRLAPYTQVEFGLHAQFLVALIHQQAEEFPEAALRFESVLTGFEVAKKAAQEGLRDNNRMRDNPAEKFRLESLLRDPSPEYVRRADFHLGELSFDQGRFPEAAARFNNYLRTNPADASKLDAQLHLGMALTQAKQYQEAIRILAPLQKNAATAEGAYTWSARARLALLNPKQPQPANNELKLAAEELSKAIELISKAPNDMRAARRVPLVFELADVQLLLNRFPETVTLYQQLLNDKSAADQVEEASRRLAMVYQAAGKLTECETLCQKFEKSFPLSPALADVLYCYAENAVKLAQQATVKSSLTNPDALKWFDVAVVRYGRVIEKFPEYAKVGQAQAGIANVHYQLGRFAEAAEAFAKLPDGDRTGELANTNYLQADCLLRSLSADTSNALAAGRVVQQLMEVIDLLGKHTAGQTNQPNMPEACLKLIHTQVELLTLLAASKEKEDLFNSMFQNCEQFKQKFGEHPLKPQMYMERTRGVATTGDLNRAVGDLNRFLGDPYRQSPVAPMALLQMSTYLRQLNRAPDALKIIEQCRTAYEAKLLADPARKEWVPQLVFEHAGLFQLTGKVPEARSLFEQIPQKYPDSPSAADAVWRAAQCQRAEAVAQIAAANKKLSEGNLPADQKTAAMASKEEALTLLRNVGTSCGSRADKLLATAAGSETQLHLYEESAIAWRTLGDIQLAAERERSQSAELEKQQAALDARIPAGQPHPKLQPHEIPLVQLPATEGERQAAAQYSAWIKAAPESPLSVAARWELAGMLFTREKFGEAINLLNDARDKDPSPEMDDKLLLLLGRCLLGKMDYTAALDKFEGLAKIEKSPVAPVARYLVGEVYFQQKNWSKVVEQLTPFRDRGELHNIPEASEKGLFRLGQALVNLQQWDAAKNTLEGFVNRFGNSPLADDTRYLIGVSRQSLKQHDEAVNWLQQVVNRSANEPAADAQLRIGQCRQEQKRFPEALAAFSAAATWYEFPEPAAQALVQSSIVYVEQKEPEQAKKVLQQVLDKYPKSTAAGLAKQRLAELK